MENKETIKLETLAEMKKKNEYEHPILLESFVEIENPVMDSEGYIRDKKEKTLNKSFITGNNVNVIESSDLKKVHGDYKRLEDKFDVMMTMFSSMMIEIRELKSTVNAQSRKIEEQSQEIHGLKLENQVLKQTINMQNKKLEEQSKMIEEQSQEIHGLKLENQKLNSVVNEQNHKIDDLTKNLGEVNRKLNESLEVNKKLREENNNLRNMQQPEMHFSHRRHKKTKYSEVYESDTEMSLLPKSNNNSDAEDKFEEVPIANPKAKPYERRPGRGFLDTFAYGFECRAPKRNIEELREAAFEGNYQELTDILNNKGVDVNGRGMPDSICSLWKGYKDRTALILATKNGHLDCVKLLITSGADVNYLDRDNRTALDYAEKNRHIEMISFLKSNNACTGLVIKGTLEKLDTSGTKFKVN